MRGMRGSFSAFSSLALLILTGSACNKLVDGVFCADDSCEWSKDEWERVAKLSPLGEPPEDPSNKYNGDRRATVLGWKLYFDADLSGVATLQDMLGRTVPSARAPLGMPTRISCATCHNPAHGGGEVNAPGNVSVGAGWYDVNGQQTLNAAHYKLLYWNGRSDSLWGQAAAVMESGVSMNGNRLDIVWTLAEKYRAEFEAVFGASTPLPMTGTRAEVRALLVQPAPTPGGPPPPPNSDGACAGGTPDACPAGCRTVTDEDMTTKACHPRYPLRGKPGRYPGCQLDATLGEPFGDAYDCMDGADKVAVTKAYVSAAKAIAAYERRLTSRNSPFDDMVAEGPASKLLSTEARRGLRLFVGRASCVDCHNTPMFSDGDFHNIGVPQTGGGVPTEADCPDIREARPRSNPPTCNCVAGRNCLAWGYADGMAKLLADPAAPGAYRRNNPMLSDDSGNAWEGTHGAFYETRDLSRLRGLWRTPSLRDSSMSGPYMHNGIYKTLEEVVWHYDQGGESGENGTKAPELKPLFLSARDRLDLVAFLRTLTGIADCPELHRQYHPVNNPEPGCL
jgi:cytochrome c peroxidase